MSKIKKSYFHIKTTKKKKKLYLNLFNDYRNYNDVTGIDASLFFSLSVEFLIEKIKASGEYEKAPEAFKNYAFRAGKRKANERSPKKEELAELNLVGKGKVNENFRDLSWYFVRKYFDSEINNPAYSKSFFFCDFLIFLDQHSKDFINYSNYK